MLSVCVFSNSFNDRNCCSYLCGSSSFTGVTTLNNDSVKRKKNRGIEQEGACCVTEEIRIYTATLLTTATHHTHTHTRKTHTG